MRTLQTDRLTLEPQRAAHAEDMFRVLSDPAIYEYENAPPESVERLRARYEFLQARVSPDGSQQWLNWVLRLRAGADDGALIGYVQATVYPDQRAAVAYELASAHWGRGLASEAVRAMIDELGAHYAVRRLTAVLKRRNHRSLRLLERLGFTPASPQLCELAGLEPDELLLQRAAVEEPR